MSTKKTAVVAPFTSINGEFTVPGDKSISHRAAIFASVAQGDSEVRGFGGGADNLSTVSCLRGMGIDIERNGDVLAVKGRGLDALREPDQPLDCGNSGTTMRMLTGLLAGRFGLFAVLTGDESLSRRPMARIATPLRRMGAKIDGRENGDKPPLAVRGEILTSIEYDLPVASAQVKSALLLAGLSAAGEVRLREPGPSRDHSERMLAAQGARITVDGLSCRLSPGNSLAPIDMDIPGDFSSAAFWISAALLAGEGEVVIKGVGLNPSRTGMLDIVRRMGASIEVTNKVERGGEPVGDLTVRPSTLKAVTIAGDEVVRAIDELPVIAVCCAFAEGRSQITGAAELRNKESDRIAVTAAGLRAVGHDGVEELPDGMVIEGRERASGGAVEAVHDHRIAMAFAVAAARCENPVTINGSDAAGVSYPDFFSQLKRLTS